MKEEEASAAVFYGVGYGFNRPDHAAAYIEVADDGTVTILWLL